MLENWRPGRWSTRSLRTEAACHCVPVLLIKMLTLAPCRPRPGCLSPRPSRASVSEDASSLVGIKWPAPLSCAAAKGRGCFWVDKELAKGARAARPGTSRKGACGGALDSKESDNLRPGSLSRARYPLREANERRSTTRGSRGTPRRRRAAAGESIDNERARRRSRAYSYNNP